MNTLKYSPRRRWHLFWLFSQLHLLFRFFCIVLQRLDLFQKVFGIQSPCFQWRHCKRLLSLEGGDLFLQCHCGYVVLGVEKLQWSTVLIYSYQWDSLTVRFRHSYTVEVTTPLYITTFTLPKYNTHNKSIRSLI